MNKGEFEINTKEQYQYPILPTGCEVTATSILLNSLYYDHKCKLDLEKIKKETLAELVEKEQDPDPITRLVGNPYVHLLDHHIVKNHSIILQNFKLSMALKIKNYIQLRLDYFNNNQLDDDSDFQILIDHMTQYNTPIIIWMTLELREPRITDEWFDCQNPSLQLFWVSPEHCATLSGYTNTHVIITDPHTGKKEKYNKSLFLKRWRQLGRQAVSVKLLNN
ncbi:hypothetical protein DICPUDRAFT_88117 [Dictyostelium purpureum]|uniref:Peptidase C39-like domain-containing protein n=1 Tax=Dictyostelium purpureum TaxID=5786 RepID=F0ZMG1_DICPU|nr:uncharacterized protein DICPUDRAFT_88117 [Dictyostelium purpureum]EGC34847.1 hypothetical protein DICPUDRAFT_88117 [Dictyostelium purpureum]|eukprot:XP_003288601.1 hypothetical protein DICPUDRAFT_88117 [Dictyostelium purpureum]